MKQAVPDLNKEIRKLKDKGMSLRQIAVALGISHEAVRKRLKNLASKEQVPTQERNQELTALKNIEGEKVSTGSNAHRPMAPEEIKDTVNQLSTQKTPSLSPTPGVNPSKISSLNATEDEKRGNSPRSDDLIGEMLRFLESKGIEVYRMQNGGYQVKGHREIVRFYITPRDG